MKKAIKNEGKIVKAYPLGAGHPMEAALITEGVIKLLEDGSYELFSQEAVNGQGQLAKPGDYFKVDTVEGKHYPYPNGRDWFEENHVHLHGDEYEQKNKPLMIWQVGDEMTDEVRWLVNSGKLTLKPEDPAHYFNAFLWGSDLSAASDATLLFYGVNRDASGTITAIDFNFVAKAEFDANYTVV